MINNKKGILFIVFVLLFSFMFSIVIFANEEVDENADKLPEIKMTGGNFNLTRDTVKQDSDQLWVHVFTKYRGVITGITGILTFIMFLMFISNLVGLAASASNPSARAESTKGLLVTGIATAGLGSITLWTGLFYNLFTKSPI